MAVGVVGMMRSGKTLYIQGLMLDGLARGRSFYVHDAYESYQGPAFPSVQAYQAEVRRTGRRPLVARFVPTEPPTDDQRNDPLALAVAELVNRTGGTLVVDEVAEAFRGAPSRALWRIARAGWKAPKATLIWASQRPTDLHRSLQMATDTLVVFRVTDELDLHWLRHNCGSWGPALAEAAPQLPNGAFHVVPRTQPLPAVLPPPHTLDTSRALWRFRRRG